MALVREKKRALENVDPALKLWLVASQCYKKTINKQIRKKG